LEPGCENERAEGVRICAQHRDENLDIPDPLEDRVLEPPDRERCQAEKSTTNFMTFGGEIGKMVRCTNKPTVIATEATPGKDGLRGSMSLCEDCRWAFLERTPPGFATFEPIGEEMYFVLTTSCDGASLEKISKEELEKRLNDEDYYCRDDQSDWMDDVRHVDLMSDAIKIIIKGEIVVPKAKEVVTKFEV
jgi:hypothetical protein